MQELNKVVRLPHNIILEERSKLSISGVDDILDYNGNSVILETTLGQLSIIGTNIQISKLNVDTGEVNIQGEIIKLCYTSNEPKGGLFSRLFK